MSHWPEPLARAYAACEEVARSHDGNCPVASRRLPSTLRPHVAAVYAFARIADDIAGERSAPAAERIAKLHAWQQRLHAAVAAEGSGRAPLVHEDVVCVALAHSIRSLDLPIALCDDLLSACGQDTMTTRYDSWADVFDYCRRSANPAGRLVLRIAGYRDEALDRSSDALCTALQLTRFWQDFGRDWLIGRLYVPRDATVSCRAREMDLNSAYLNDAWMAAMRQCVDQTRAQFEAGRAVCDEVRGRLRLELRVTWIRGMRILDQVERTGAALLGERPAIRKTDWPLLLWRAVRWPSQG